MQRKHPGRVMRQPRGSCIAAETLQIMAATQDAYSTLQPACGTAHVPTTEHNVNFSRSSRDAIRNTCTCVHMCLILLLNWATTLVHCYTNIKRCSYLAQLHILSFYRIEADKSCHLYVYMHTLTSNVARILRDYTFCHSTESRQTTHVTSTCIYIH